ncbi:MAG: alpha/beta hydrolase fold family protein [Xanthomonadaceae bacterium]|nr:alpha/beta hydrolase fold family protein [Xanthomonadaceae bacterium]
MGHLLKRISTIVRNAATLGALRLTFRFESLLAPDAAIRRAGRIFCTPFASSRSRALHARLDGACETTLVIGGLPIEIYTWGDPSIQPYVLFAHGWYSHCTRIQSWVAPLRDAGYALVAFDQAGHGKSGGRLATLPGFTDLLMDIGRRHGPAAAVIGHSLGGAATAAALVRGLDAQRAILIAPAADPVDAAFRFARFVGLPGYLCRRMIAGFEQRIGIPFADFQAHRNAPRIARPALIVHDVGDREVPWAEGERYARFWADSRLMSTQGLGHNRIADDAGVITACVRFLSGEAVGERVVSSRNLPYGFA